MDIEAFFQSIGYLGIFICVFIESGVIFGLVLPLPGFSLVFTASVLTATSHKFNLLAVVAVGVAACILGYVVGYETGRRYGPKVFYREHSRFFNRDQGEKTKKFMKRYGYPTLVIGRFLPFMHSATPLLSGFAKTPYLPFTILNVIGAVLWTLSAVSLGYFLGQSVPHAQYIAIPFVIILVVLANTKPGRAIASKINAKLDEADS